jgi:hypothetical protein
MDAAVRYGPGVDEVAGDSRSMAPGIYVAGDYPGRADAQGGAPAGGSMPFVTQNTIWLGS